MIAADMPVTAIAPWYGGKRTMAPRIVAELGKHVAYWEPFCGSMAVLFAKQPSTMETVNDLHGDLINLARCVRDPVVGPRLYRHLRRCLNSQADFIAARERCGAMAGEPAELDADRAADYFLTSWQGMNGVAGTARYNLGFARRMTKNGGHAAKRFASAVTSIPAWRRRLRAVNILKSDGIELCERIEDARGVVIYVDPPYVDKGAQYLHDFDGIDHHRLAKAVRRFQHTRVVVSYYDHPWLRDLYPGWTVVPCHRTKALVSQGRRNKSNNTVAPEVLLINGPSYTAEAVA
jgi:DNA adenine methylase